MKRSESLKGLSREHHGALALASRVRRVALAGDGAALAATLERVRVAFRSELLPHFEEEERRLLPVLEKDGQTDLVARTLAEHREMACLVASLPAGGADILLAFADLLGRHVRFEERELFPALEALTECQSSVPWDDAVRLQVA